MENNRTADTNDDASYVFDPASDLDLLKRSQSGVAINNILDFGPWWYVPLIANCVGGVMLFTQESGAPFNLGFGIIGVGSGLFLSLHDYRRRAVRPKKSATSVLLMAMIVTLTLITVLTWGVASSTAGFDDFVPLPALGLWVVTVAVWSGVRQIFHTLLARRTVLA